MRYLLTAAALLLIAACTPTCAELLAVSPSGRRGAPRTMRQAKVREKERGANAQAKPTNLMVKMTARSHRNEVKESIWKCPEPFQEQMAGAPEAKLETGCGVSRRLFEDGEKQADGANIDSSAPALSNGSMEAASVAVDNSVAALPNAPADIDLDCELEDETLGLGEQGSTVSRAAREGAKAAAEHARQMAQRGMLAISIRWSTCMEQARHVASACSFESAQISVQRLAGAASRLVPPSPARKGLQTLVTESTSLWMSALWKILMLQLLVVIKTVVSQGNVIARSFIQAACLEPRALVPDSPVLQRQRSRTKALAVKAEVEAARARMIELQKQMYKTAETLRAAERASNVHLGQPANEGAFGQWGEVEYFSTSASSCGNAGAESWWAARQDEKHVSFEGTSGSLSPVNKQGRGVTCPSALHGRPSTPSQALLMSACRKTPLPASPLPPRTPAAE